MLRSLTLILITTLTFLVFLAHDRPSPSPPPSATLTIERVQSLGTLVTTRVTVHSQRRVRLDGLLGGLTTNWHGRGTVLLGPDLRRAEITDRDDARRTATVRLPEPAVLERTLDLTSGEWREEADGLWQFVCNDRLTAAEQQRLLHEAQNLLGDAITAAERATARDAAIAVVRELGQSLHWTLNVQ